MFEKNRIKKVVKLLILLLLLIMLFEIVNIAFSKYESDITSRTNVDVACFVLDEQVQNVHLNLGELVPRSEPYVYTFSIANYTDEKVADVDLEYTVSIRATTNLPLRYKLYLNENYTNQNANDIIISNSNEQDEYGTYFKNLITDPIILRYNTQVSNLYYLVIEFPSQYEVYQYQNIIESIELVINSEQILE